MESLQRGTSKEMSEWQRALEELQRDDAERRARNRARAEKPKPEPRKPRPIFLVVSVDVPSQTQTRKQFKATAVLTAGQEPEFTLYFERERKGHGSNGSCYS